MGRWKRAGVIVVLYSTDHDPRHVHVFEDGKRVVKFDIESWTVMEGKLTSKARKALELLHEEGVNVPSNLSGLVYVPFPKGAVEAALHVVERELRAIYKL